MDWNVKNAMSRDVEREHLNKILKDIRARIDTLTATQEAPVRPPTPPLPVSSPVTVTLVGDVTGTATGRGNVTIETELAAEFDGVEEAPNDGSVYWRGNEQWQTVPLALQLLGQLEGEGLLALSPAGVFESREIVGTDGEIDVENGTGIELNPTLSLADVPNAGGGILQKTEFDSKGRLVGSSFATTDDLEEGATNLYFSEERAVEAVQELLDEKLDYTSLKTALVAGANITLTSDDLDETITITSTGGGGGGGGVEAVLPGAGIEVDSSDPTMPAVSLSLASQAALALAASALQAGDNISELANDAGYVDVDEAALAAPVQSVNNKTGVVVLTAPDVGADTVGSAATALSSANSYTDSGLSGKVGITDVRLSDAREWTALTVPQSEAEAGAATTRRAWTAQRVRQAITAWWAGSADKTKLDGVEAGATVGASWSTNLSGTPTNIQTLATNTWTPEVIGNDFNLTGSNPVEISLGVKNTGGGTPVFHYYRRNPTGTGRPLSGQLIGGAGSRPWSVSSYTSHSTAAYHLSATEDHTATAQGTDFLLLATPIGGTNTERVQVARFNGDGDIISSRGLTSRKVNAIERGRGLEIARNGPAEISMVGSEPAGYTTLFRGYAYGGNNLNSPTAVAASMGTGYAFCGYDGTHWVGAKALVALRAAADWSNTSTPTYIALETTAEGSTGRTPRVTVMPNGPLLLHNNSGRAEIPTGGGYLFVENGALKFKGSSGTITTIAPP